MPQKEYAPKYLKTGMTQDNLMAALLARERGEDVVNVKGKEKIVKPKRKVRDLIA